MVFLANLLFAEFRFARLTFLFFVGAFLAFFVVDVLRFNLFFGLLPSG